MEETEARWPIGELARRVAAALAVGYDGPGNARVRGVPDVRSIRWYATIGLLDKPAAYRGRTALYGPRHLRQLVAVKRRQAAGVALSDIQAELAGASPEELAELARVPGELLDGEPSGQVAASDPRPAPAAEAAFWKSQPVTVTVAEPAGHAPPAAANLSYGLKLAEGLTLLVDATRCPTPEDHEAVQAAAQPLLRALKARGLLTTAYTGAKP